jgi:hypothetical protein
MTRPFSTSSGKVSRTSRGVAQPGSALGLGPRGRRFESSRPDHFLFSRAILTSIKSVNHPSSPFFSILRRNFALFCRLYCQSVVYLAGSFSNLLKFWRWETTNGDHGYR